MKRLWPARLWRAIQLAAQAFSSPEPQLILRSDGAPAKARPRQA